MEETTVKNKYGIDVKRCCASCQNKKAKDGVNRTCGLSKKDVKPYFVCSEYAMHEKLDNAGKGSGRIKRKNYLMYVLEKKGVSDAERTEWKHIHGSIYYV